MRRCYRNSRQVVELAFNVLLGTQAATRATTRTYADMADLKEHDMVEEQEDYIQVYFADREGPAPVVNTFKGYSAEIEWVAGEVVRLIREEAVRPEDILILFDKPGQVNLHQLRKRITEQIPGQQFVEPYGKNDKDEYILQPGCLTLSTVYGAKGYDAPIVFVIGADRFPYDTIGRAMFYVAATRAKWFLYVSGVEGKRSLLNEAETLAKRLSKENHEDVSNRVGE
jgi:superfamily I DNA and RNA helicase